MKISLFLPVKCLLYLKCLLLVSLMMKIICIENNFGIKKKKNMHHTKKKNILVPGNAGDEKNQSVNFAKFLRTSFS